MEGSIDGTSALGSDPAARVLVFSVDDGLFSVQLDWIDAVYEKRAAEMHRVRIERGPWQEFLLHRGEPALVVDLRDAFDLADTMGDTERVAYVVLRSGGLRLAVAIDHVVGVQDLDVATRTPVPTNLQRDGGIPVGHLVELDGRMLAVLDPNRILSRTDRDRLEPLWTKARAFGERHLQIADVWERICTDATANDVRGFARLCSRNGRSKAAAAARAVGKLLEDESATAPSGSLQDRLCARLVAATRAAASGEVRVLGEGGNDLANVFVAAGRVVDAHVGSEWGRRAFVKILQIDDGRVDFAERGIGEHPERIAVSTPALLIDALEAAGNEARRRRAR